MLPRLSSIARHIRPFSTTKMSSQTPNILLLTTGTPNGQKVSITLEELGLPYETKSISLQKNEQKEDWFLKVCPNGRIPALVDRTAGEGKELNFMESGAIMQYLTATYDKDYKISYPYGTPEYWETQQWMFWMNAGLGPMQGQANHFYRYAPEKIEYGINRYINETKRLYSVLEDRLAKNPSGWLVGDRMTIADIACFSWVNWAFWAGVDSTEFKKLTEWEKRINEREAVKRGLDVPEPFTMKAKMQSKEEADKYAEESRKWIMQGNDKEKK
ncbi:putative glutathione S-transferase [Saitoella complicata NRRL Y-17804]|uniref:putative glutathione S-transferase n=1 Tax=Saitoella complicata (strain BCRC 22490 / CBS 7301 / JCM 7358 / NBRC 10748 / NRRL Y-17804) TaxID=698492 RepID=UPI000867658C|nr:putative glutathione S-transferase [Saitoella complicata NRRL Y-17804]ODQ50804.1 putative glutathione S-transferase [Saitoella complicata NRRL Y-17804]